MNTQHKININQTAAEFAYNAILNCYLRESSNWHKFFNIPRYDHGLNKYFNQVNHSRWIKILVSDGQNEIYCPVRYYSETGRHLFDFPIVYRKSPEDELKPLNVDKFYQFISRDLSDSKNSKILYERIAESISNTEYMLESALQHDKNEGINRPFLSFIESEQALLLGHPMHPASKSRTGFSRKDLFKYSPEFRNSFQLHYFLADTDLVEEKSVLSESLTEKIKRELLSAPNASNEVKEILSHYPDKKLIPCHPWESGHLIKSEDVQELIRAGKLVHLGACGPFYTATSSVRTVYSEQSDYMLKFSMHIKITNSERVNLERELYRGYDISRLMQTSWGESLQEDYPNLTFITDPGFISLKNLKGKTIEGFNTVVRTNTFKEQNNYKNVSNIAALCQDGLFGKNSRLSLLIKDIAQKKGIALKSASLKWFDKYLDLTLVPFVGIYNTYGLACEAHQQNLLLEMDENGMPGHIYFRDNQGYYFREGKSEEFRRLLPDLGSKSEAIIPEDYIHPKYTYYFIINNLLGVVNAFGINNLCNEKALLMLMVNKLKELQPSDTTGFIAYLLNSRDWSVKGNLLTSIRNMDEARQPVSNPAEYKDYPNPLHFVHFSSELILPEHKGISYKRVFHEKGLEIVLRPFDLDKDLEMVHEWFNREHTKAFWKMDGPIRQLEAFYITLLNANHSHAFIGEVNGTPTFTIEPYWPMRDLVGKYYPALPSDYGAHLLISETDKDKKHTMECAQTLMEFIFNQPQVGKCIGEADVNAKPMHILVTRLGFKLQQVIHMPHKSANLTFCTKEWYKSRFPNCQIKEEAFMDNLLKPV